MIDQDGQPASRDRDPHGEETGFADRLDAALAALWIGDAAPLEVVVSEVAEDEHESGVIASLEPAGLVGVGALPSIAGHELRSVLGRGGMGVVYSAIQVATGRRVAIKVLRGGATVSPRDVALFRREISALSRLTHPGIAQILELGDTTDGLPWFSMEMVSGGPIHRHARRMRTTAERLGLFLQVCEAVQFAHESGVIHRDLKPSNVMVDAEGRTKVLDFGLARILDADDAAAVVPPTRTGVMLGTAPYMSPEQIRGLVREIDERTDVHALGVLLTEVLTDDVPYPVDHGRAYESARAVLEDRPRLPSSIDPRIPRELDAVVQQAIEKDPGDRYPSVAHISEDLRRFLAGRPVLARRPSSWYQLRRWAARRRRLASAAVVAVVAVLSAVTAIGVGFARAREANANTARAETDRDALHLLLQALFDSADPRKGAHADLTMREFLVGAAARMDTSFAASPEVGALIRSDIGAAMHGIGELTEAENELRRARAVLLLARPPDDPGLARATRNLGHLLHATSQLEEAEELLRLALEAQLRSLGGDHLETFTTRNDLGWLMQALGEADAAEGWFRENATRARQLEWMTPADRSYHVAALGHYLFEDGANEEARERLTEALEIATCGGSSAPDTAAIQTRLAAALARDGEYARARYFLRESIDALERSGAGDGLVAAGAWAARGELAMLAGMPAEGVSAYEESVARTIRCCGPSGPLTLCRQASLADALFASGRREEAVRAYDALLAIEARERGDDTLEYAKHLLKVAPLRAEVDGLAAGTRDLDRAGKIALRRVTPAHPIVFRLHILGGSFAAAANAWQEAANQFALAGRSARAGGAARARDLGEAQCREGTCYVELGDVAHAARVLETGIATLAPWPEDPHRVAAIQSRDRLAATSR